MNLEFSGIAEAAVLIAMALVGIGLLKAGLWPRRWGKERRCGRCEYVVENISGERCPECGSLLVGRGTVVGERRRLPALWGSGAFLLLIAVLWGGNRIYGGVRLHQLKPTAWVFNELESKDLRTRERAWMELMQRLEAGALSSSWEERMADVSLSEHLASVTTVRGGQADEFLWRQYRAGRLNAQQVERLLGQLVRAKWKFRPVVLVGQDLPYRVEAERYFRDGWMKFGISGEFRAIFEQGFYVGFIHESVLSGSARKSPGEQEVELPYFVEYYSGPYERPKEESAKPIWRREYVHREKITVLENANEEYLKPVDSPELEERIRNSIEIKKFGYHSSRFYFDMDVSCKSPPINVAFDVLARIDNKEYPITQLIAAKDMDGPLPYSFLSNLGVFKESKPAKVDLIFRSNEALAGKTVGFFEVWKGEVIFKDVPVASPPQK